MNVDKYYKSLWDATHSFDDLMRAGFIPGKPLYPEFNLDMYSTPVHLLNDSKLKEQSVILYTGSFAPMHYGHIETIREAKNTIESQTEEKVTAAFISPDHDDYIERKISGQNSFGIFTRIQAIEESIKDEDWIQIDPWAGTWAKTDLNFTTLYERFIQYCRVWAPKTKVKVYFLFGSDNASFEKSFLEFGHGVCVKRENYPIENFSSPRVLYSINKIPNYSSSEIRKNKILVKETVKVGDKYIIRNDLKHALPEFLINRFQEIHEELLKIFANSIPEGVTLQTIDVASQIDGITLPENTISLDAFHQAKYNLNLTRLFKANDSQRVSKNLISRSRSEKLKEQLKRIPEGKYCLVDDDIASGFTMKYVENLLSNEGIEISEKRSLIEKIHGVFDVVDARDFIIGSKNGGLTIETPKGITRIPYAWPHVNLSTRAKIPPEKILNLSREIWEINKKLYKDSATKVKDLSEQDFTKVGLPGDWKIWKVCDYYSELIEANLKTQR